MLIAIIPTMQADTLVPFALLEQIQHCHQRPDEVIVINNCSKKMPIDDFYKVVDNDGQNIGVNASWNYGISRAQKMNASLCILNDDIKIRYDFFNRIRLALSFFRYVQVLCPKTTHRLSSYKTFATDIDEPVDVKPMNPAPHVRNGWAFTISSEFIKKLPLIPNTFFTFLGDDWIKKCLPNWYMDINNVIYHEIGLTLKQNPEIRNTLKGEKRIWNKMMGKK